jgi:hypothetical protein
MDESMRVFDPSAPCHNAPQQLRHSLDGLAGKTIGFIDNAKPNFNNLVDELAELLVGKYGVAKVVKRSKFTPSIPASDKLMMELTAECDAVIAGSGD